MVSKDAFVKEAGTMHAARKPRGDDIARWLPEERRDDVTADG
jgi:hypothetical protein